jgi:hypothetical protein
MPPSSAAAATFTPEELARLRRLRRALLPQYGIIPRDEPGDEPEG